MHKTYDEKKTGSLFIRASNGFIESPSTKEKFRFSKRDFTRDRKLPFERLVLCMLRLLRKNLQLELHAFFNALGAGMKQITSSAFVQNRRKLKPDLFYELNHLIVKEYFTDNDGNVKLYKGLRVLSVDGSTINLPASGELLKRYGFFNNQKKTNDVVIGRVSVLYDVLNEIVLDGLLRPFSEGEIALSGEHFKYARNGDLIITDRAYPSFDTAWFLRQRRFIFYSGANDKILACCWR